MFLRIKDSMKSECYFFRAYKQRNKVSLVYLEYNVEQNRYSRCILKLNCQKVGESIYLERRKQHIRYR